MTARRGLKQTCKGWLIAACGFYNAEPGEFSGRLHLPLRSSQANLPDCLEPEQFAQGSSAKKLQGWKRMKDKIIKLSWESTGRMFFPVRLHCVLALCLVCRASCLFTCDPQIPHCGAAKEAAGLCRTSNSLETSMQGCPWPCLRLWMMRSKVA